MKSERKIKFTFNATQRQIDAAAEEVHHMARECPALVRVLDESGLGNDSRIICLFYLLARARRNK